MDDDLIDARLSACILGALDLTSFPLRRGTRAYEVPGWDSLSHAMIVVAVEDEYGVRFSTRDVVGLQSVGDLERLIERSIAQKK
ncbi:MAG: acyl carrier protein [Gemmatimonadota bacterium]